MIAPAEFVALLQEAFDRGQELTFVPSGTSMRPTLDGREDAVTLAPVTGPLRRFDVALYRRSDGQLVLHRMVSFDADGGYLFCGDAQYIRESGVTDDAVLARMTAYTHRGKHHSVNSLRFRLYSRRIVAYRRMRRCLSNVYHKIKHS